MLYLLLPIVTKLLPLFDGTMKVIKHGWRSKTVVFGALLVFFSGLQAILPDLAAYLGPHGPAATAIIGVIVVILRALTSAPLDDK